MTSEPSGGIAAGTTAPSRPSWWRRNRFALVAVVLLVPAVVFVLAGVPLLDDAVHDPAARRVVAAEHPAIAFGRSWTLTASKEFVGTGADADAGGNGIPVGSSLIGVLLHEKPVAGKTPPRHSSCGVELVAPDPSGGELPRSWNLLDDPADYRYGLGDTTTPYCTFDVTGDTVLEFVFLVPRGTAAHASVLLTFGGGATSDPEIERLRFALD